MQDAGSTSPIDGLTLEEKASLTSGRDFWHTKSAGSIPSIMVSDGPNGLRKQATGGDHLGLGGSVPATCFPPAVGLGASWDPELVERVGVALGVEASIENVSVLLGPGINIKRSPLCGRNFEYFSEDPLVSGVIGAAWVRGVQSQGVGASLKHFAANSQETDRLRISSDVDIRTLREIYLRGFQRVVEDAQPWTVMCSYNRINGVYASENHWLISQVLREEWGFKGLVVSDWGAVNDRVAGLAAGLDLEMPASGGATDAQIVAAVSDGSLDERVLDAAAARVAALALRSAATARVAGPLDVDAYHALAREAAGRSVILLKNEGDLLPLAPETNVAVIGEFAQSPRYQGAGSSRINPTRLDRAIDEIRGLATGAVTFDAGFSAGEEGGLAAEPAASAASEAQAGSAGSAAAPDQLRAEAVAAAAAADVAVVFLGLPGHLESEGFDRADISLPAEQLALLDAVLAANPRTVVVFSHGGVVALPFADRVPAVLDASLLGQAGGGGTADVLYGVVNPSAKLTETVPVRLEDNPSYDNFPGEHGHVRYCEGLFVGYRGYDHRDLPVTFPFGHGLSYTSFEYSDAIVAEVGGGGAGDGSGDIEVRVTVTNVGDRDGAEVVQVYASVPGSAVTRPVRELKGFGRIALAAGESGEAVITVRREDLAYWDIRVDRWIVEHGDYTFEVGASSRDIRAAVTFAVSGDEVTVPISRESSLGEVFANPRAMAALQRAIKQSGASSIETDFSAELQMMLASFPVGRMGMFGLSPDQIDAFVRDAN